MNTEKSDETDRDPVADETAMEPRSAEGDAAERASEAEIAAAETGADTTAQDIGQTTDSRYGDSEPASDPEPPDNADHATTDTEYAQAEPEQGSSFASKALTFLVVLLGGAALGIWAAPKVAPMLPSGMAPVASWLTPGQSAVEDRVALLQSRVEEEVGGLATRLADVPDAAAIEASARNAISEAEERLEARITAVEETVAGSDLTDTRQRLARVEAGLEGQLAELASLKDQIAAGGGEMSAEAAASLDLYRAEIEGLRAEMGTLGGTVEALGTRVDTVAAEADERVAAAEATVETVEAEAQAAIDVSDAEAKLAAIEAAIVAGEPFAAPLDDLAARTGTTPPEPLAAAAPSGVVTAAALRERFPDAAYAAIRASIMAAAGEGVVERSRAYLEAQVASRSLTPQPGLTPDAVLSRVEDALKRDDLDAALAEADALPSEAAAAMDDWLSAARQRAGALTGLAELSASLATLN
jgi:hypothetical protein